jgi:hypothetical protein
LKSCLIGCSLIYGFALHFLGSSSQLAFDIGSCVVLISTSMTAMDCWFHLLLIDGVGVDGLVLVDGGWR